MVFNFRGIVQSRGTKISKMAAILKRYTFFNFFSQIIIVWRTVSNTRPIWLASALARESYEHRTLTLLNEMISVLSCTPELTGVCVVVRWESFYLVQSGAAPGYFYRGGQLRGCGLQKNWGDGVTPLNTCQFCPICKLHWGHFVCFFVCWSVFCNFSYNFPDFPLYSLSLSLREENKKN